jgi:hypothetical protein
LKQPEPLRRKLHLPICLSVAPLAGLSPRAQEYGKFPSEINISPIKDPAKRPAVFSWQEKTSVSLVIFSFEANEKTLSIVRLYKPIRNRAVHTNEVLKCKDK